MFKLSRFGRNTADVLYNVQLMQDYGVNLLAVDEGIDSGGPSGKLMASVISAVSEIERDNIKAQTMAGRWQKAREGRWNGGQAPYGYRLENGVLVIEEEEAKIVRLIYDRYVTSQMGLNGIAKWLNDDGYQKKLRQNSKYIRFSSSFVKNVLDNPVYKGVIAYGRRKTEKIEGKRNEYHVVKQDEYQEFPGMHKAIVAPDLWEQAHAKRLATGVRHEKTHSLEHVHLLPG